MGIDNTGNRVSGDTGNRAGSSLRFLRELAGLTLAEVATAAQTSASYLSKVETGVEAATPTYIARVTGAIADEMRGKAA